VKPAILCAIFLSCIPLIGCAQSQDHTAHAQDDYDIVVKEIHVTGTASSLVSPQSLSEVPSVALYSIEQSGKRLAAILGPQGNIDQKVIHLKSAGILFLGIQSDRANFTIHAIRLRDSAVATVDLQPLEDELSRKLNLTKDAKPWAPFQLTSMKLNGTKLDCIASADGDKILIPFSITLPEPWPANAKLPLVIEKN
jgi:hypothetical protein